MENSSGTQREAFRGIQTDTWSPQEKQGKTKMSKMRHCGKVKYYSKREPYGKRRGERS